MVSNLIRELREARSLTRPQLAARCSIARAHLWAIENGKKIPSLVTLEQVADASGVGMKTLLDDSFPVFLLDPLTLAVQPLVKSLNLEARESILTTLKALANTETK